MSDQVEWDFGIATYTEYDDDDHLGASLDHCGEEKAGAPPAETLMPLGLYARQLDPEVDGQGQPKSGCVSLWGRSGDSIVQIPLKDARTIPKLPRLKKGETLLFNCFGQFVRLDEKHQITLFTTDDGTNNGNSVYFQVAPDGFRAVAPWGTLKYDKTGCHILTASGARIDLGGISGIPLFGSYVNIAADTIKLSGAVSIGAAGPQGHQSVALFAPLAKALAALIVSIGKIPGADPVSLAAVTQQLALIEGALKTG